MTVGPRTWAGLEAGPSDAGSTWLRLHPKSGHDLFLSVHKPDLRRRLVLSLPAAPSGTTADRIRDSRGIRVLVEQTSTGPTLVVELADRLFVPVFDPLVTDIAKAAARADTPQAALGELLRRLEFWRSLLQELAAGGMSTTRRRGLVGELHCLGHLLLTTGGVAPRDAVLAWTGPYATNQDFQFDGSAIEVKATTAKKPQALVITNERELDSVGAGNLLLVAVSLDERQGGDGRSLNMIVEHIKALLGGDPVATQHLGERLAAYGYLPAHHDQYDEPRYTVRDEAAWHVRDAFPRIVESELRLGVGDVEYRIVTAGLDAYAVDLARVAAVAQGASP